MVIGISGGSGSGKTCFVRDLNKAFDSAEIVVISMDNYYRPRDQQNVDEEGYRNFDLPGSLDSEAFVLDLKKMIAGEVVEKTEYVFNNAEKESSTLTFTSAPVIVVEGLFIFHYQEVKDLLDYKLFLDAGDDQKVMRRIKRDGIERNYPLEDVLYRYNSHVKPSYLRYIAPYKREADLVVNNFNQYTSGLEIVSGFVRDYLRKQA